MIKHDTDPHTPGEMYDCPLCSAVCFCDELREDPLYTYEEDTVCVHCQFEDERRDADIERRLGRQAA